MYHIGVSVTTPDVQCQSGAVQYMIMESEAYLDPLKIKEHRDTIERLR